MLRLLAAASLWLVLTALLLGEVGPVLATTLGAEDHVCACPLDADGHCECPDCIRLDVHGDRDARGDTPRAETRPLWKSHCGPRSDLPALATLDPWDLAEPTPEPPPPPRDLLPSPAAERAPVDPDLPTLDRPPRRG